MQPVSGNNLLQLLWNTSNAQNWTEIYRKDCAKFTFNIKEKSPQCKPGVFLETNKPQSPSCDFGCEIVLCFYSEPLTVIYILSVVLVKIRTVIFNNISL